MFALHRTRLAFRNVDRLHDVWSFIQLWAVHPFFESTKPIVCTISLFYSGVSFDRGSEPWSTIPSQRLAGGSSVHTKTDRNPWRACFTPKVKETGSRKKAFAIDTKKSALQNSKPCGSWATHTSFICTNIYLYA